MAGATFLFASVSLHAATLAESTFSAGAEGWEVGDFFSSTGATSPTWLAAGGNPGGFIQTTDIFDWNAFQAPAAFLGNQSAAYGGSLHLDSQVLASDGADYPMVAISDGSTILQFPTAPPGTAWTSYDISLLASAGWEVSDGAGNSLGAATEAQLQTVLGNLQFLNVDADWLTGNDTVGLDNVRLSSPRTTGVPDGGSSLALFSIAVVGLAALRRK